MSETIQLRETNPEDTDSMAQYESPEGEAVCASYVARKLADRLGEYAEVTISADGDTNVRRSGVSGGGTGNYAVFETAGGSVTGFYLAHDVWAEVIGESVETDEGGVIQNAPDALRFEFAPSDEDAWQEALGAEQEAPDDEVDDLLATGAESQSASETDEEEDEEVSISDEELDLVADEA